jgi:hypothetical protein
MALELMARSKLILRYSFEEVGGAESGPFVLLSDLVEVFRGFIPTMCSEEDIGDSDDLALKVRETIAQVCTDVPTAYSLMTIFVCDLIHFVALLAQQVALQVVVLCGGGLWADDLQALPQ